MRRTFFTRRLTTGLSLLSNNFRFSSTTSDSDAAASSSSSPTLGGSFEKAGYSGSLKTPSFGDISSMPSPPDLGHIDTKPATNLTVEKDLQGPWIFLASPKLEGELFVRENGAIVFRPGNCLGYGIGKLKLNHTATGTAVAEIDLETYLYEATSKSPPLHPTKFTFVVSFSVASAESQGYKTITMHGQAIEKSSSNNDNNNNNNNSNNSDVKAVTAANAAKLEPWDPKGQPLDWTPDPQIEQGFKVLFPRPFTISRLDPKKKPIELANYKVGPIKNVYYVPNYVNAEEEQECLIQNRETPTELKNKLDRRVVQEYGGTMCGECKKSFVSDANIPPWTNRICDALVKDTVFSPTTFPNNVRIHDYESGHGIAPHCDGPIYVPRVAILSLGAPVLMSFYAKRPVYEDVMEHYNDTFKHEGDIAKEAPMFSLVLEPRSLLVFDDDAYWFHPHGIAASESDSLDEEKVGPIVNREFLQVISEKEFAEKKFKRDHRVGVTIRNLLPRCSHEPMRAEYQMLRAQRVLEGQDANGNKSSNNILSPNKKKEASSIYSAMSRPPQKQQQQKPSASSPITTNNNSSGFINNSASSSKSLESKLDKLLERQTKIEHQLKEIQTLLAFNTQRNVKFETEVSGVLDHVSNVILDVQAKVDDVVETVDELRDHQK